MTREQITTSIFLLTNKLKDKVKRSGWFQKGIKRHRVESVADHIYGCQMLAYAMYSEFNYDVDISKVILMLALHEIGETIIGDITPDDMPSSQKRELERKATLKLLSMIPNGDFIKDIFLEFEEGKTPEAQFAYQIDKAECDLQAKLYAQEGCFSPKYDKDEFAQNWIGFDRNRIEFDDNFDSVLEYVTNNDMKVTKHSDNPIENVVSFYMATNGLKDKKRKGEEIWKVKKDHYGSVAEHIFSVQMLAIIIFLVYEEKIDIKKVVNLISTHELGEIINGDIDALSKTDKDKANEYDAAVSVSSILTNGKLLLKQLDEFESKKTEESKYAKYCDKLAPDIISKIYDELGLIDINDQNGNKLINHPKVKKLLDEYNSFSTMWILYGQDEYEYPEPYISVSNYALNNNLDEPFTKVLKREGFSIAE